MVLNELLSRDLIKIYQDPSLFNFSIDSILLADFCNIKKTKTILDIGTGNAPIPLFLSFKKPSLDIHAVEIQTPSFNLAKKNVEINNLSNIHLYNANILDLDFPFLFDHVVSNPPFFKINHNNLNLSLTKQIARHEVYLTLDDLVRKASTVLKDFGIFTLIHRADRLDEIIVIFKKYNITLKKIRFVYNDINSDALCVLIEGIKRGRSGSLKVLKPLIIRSNGDFTSEMKEIYYGRDFCDQKEEL